MNAVVPDPENPFVRNPFFFANVTSQSFADTPFAFAHRLNNIALAAVGIPLAALLFFLILRKAPTHLKPYSRILLVCTMADLLVVATDIFCQARVRITSGMLLVSFRGPASLLSYEHQRWAMSFQSMVAIIGVAILPAEYFIRLQIIQSHTPDLHQTVGYFCFPLIFVVFVGITGYFGYFPLDERDYGRHWYQEQPIPTLVVGHTQNPVYIVHVLSCGIVMCASDAVAMYLGRKSVSQLAKKSSEWSQRTRLLHKQLAWQLLLQSISPLFSVVPILIAVVFLIAGEGRGNLGDYVLGTIGWCPVTTMLGTLWCIKPFRKYCADRLGCCRKNTRVVHSSGVAVVDAAPQRSASTRT
ncbi:hypothetical protein M3Y99_00379600 [Aphelenchoides fujianensis]|nr:hypothetical protein M3Y99_00379600 [Aphelenchoides fujianensis]